MLTIRFSRVGRKNRAQFRIVLQENTVAPTGRHVAVLGSYDPHHKVAVLKADEIKEWIDKGAQVSDTAYNLFVKEGIIEGKKRAVKIPKPEPKVEEKVESPKVEPGEKKEDVNPPAGGEEKKEEAPAVEAPAEEKAPEEAAA